MGRKPRNHDDIVPTTRNRPKADGSDSWSYEVYFGRDPLSHKKKRLFHGGFKSQTLALKAGYKAIEDYANGQHVKESQITTEAVIDEFLENLRKNSQGKNRTIKGSTVRTKTSYFKIIRHQFGPYPIQDITPVMCFDFFDELFSRHTSGYAQMIKSNLGQLFEYALFKGIIKNNPATHYRRKQERITLDELKTTTEITDLFLEKHELVKFLKTAKEYTPYFVFAYFHTLAYSGMRPGEGLALAIDNVEIDSAIIKVKQRLWHGTLDTPKTNLSIRELEMSPPAMAVISKMIKTQKAMRLAYPKSNFNTAGFIFVDHHGKVQSSPTFYNWFAIVLKKSGIGKTLTLKSLRHTHASLMAEAGASLEEIYHRLGHKNDRMVRDIYLHVTKARKAATAARFDVLMQDAWKSDGTMTEK